MLKVVIKLMQDAFLRFYFVSLRVRRKTKKLSDSDLTTAGSYHEVAPQVINGVLLK